MEKPLTKTEKKLLKQGLGKLKENVQGWVNKYIRLRDRDRPCISCNQNSVDDAGHYIAVGRCEKLRFDYDNIHGQCRSCNYFGHGELVDYRRNLIKKIGIDRVEDLEMKYQFFKRDISKWDKIELLMIRRDAIRKIHEIQ